ncbi:hypothetical protein [Chengkuizengella sediminis]|uniref:hypothetical protein n=1 Tax=Chengkuizengella sediminis TaxID=1885917 RepID=UPI00138A1E9F|nr:hypothetical protein [Chengkuizengella sediminis]NDI36626.1 hypothetical protein [Chengkuizengella sediminis]
MSKKNKLKTQGSTITGRFTNDESALIIDWWNHQSNAFQSVKYLIEKEILQNGIKNLNQLVPSDRDIDRLFALKQSGHPDAIQLIEQVYGLTNKQIAVTELTNDYQQEVITGNIGQTKITEPIRPKNEENQVEIKANEAEEISKKSTHTPVLKPIVDNDKKNSGEKADLGMSAEDADNW